MTTDLLVAALLLPMFGSLITVFMGKANYRIRAYFAFAVAAITFILMLLVASTVWVNGTISVASDWLTDLGVSLILYVDPLAIFFALIASFFGLIAIIYSIDDMLHEKGTTRYYSLMLLFLASMIGLVTSGNFLIMYGFWELVGLCSFSLIGFYKEQLESNQASFKAFFITRTLGICLLLGAIILFMITGSFDVPVVLQRLQAEQFGGIVNVVVVLFLLAAMAKSVQIPFHTWLPDATVAPSAVTSYLHAAAMVKAGVYLLSRVYPITLSVDAGPYLSFLIATVGTITLTLCTMAAWAQQDVKRIIAFSTCAQIGYMFLGIGIGTTFGAIGGTFHLLNHAIFKGLLFLCAGSLIYATGTRNIDEMGGLGRKMPLTAAAMIIGALSVVGVPPLNGFASKLMIYEATLQRGMDLGGPIGAAYVAYCAIALFSSAVTFAYYMRLINSAFFGRIPENLKDVKDVSISMQIPLLVLSILCFAFGVYPQLILSVLVNPGVSAFTGMSLSELNSAITGLGFRTGIGLYEATGLTLAVVASILVGTAIYKTTASTQPSDTTGDKYGVFIGGEASLPYIDVERTDVNAKTFTYAAERTLGELQNVMWIARIDQIYYGLASGVQRLCDAASACITSRIGMIASVVVVLGSAFLGSHYPGLVLMILGVITALAQKKLWRLLVCAAATQIGWIAMEIAFEYPKGVGEALFYLMNFAVFGMLLTLSSWSVVRRTGSNEIRDLRGLSSKMPVAAIAFLAGGLSMSGVPAFGGWIDEFYFIRSTFEAGRIELTIIGIAVSILTLAYVLRTFNQVFLGELPERYKEIKGSSAPEIVLMVILVALSILMGVAPHFFISYMTKLVSIVS